MKKELDEHLEFTSALIYAEQYVPHLSQSRLHVFLDCDAIYVYMSLTKGD